jgi:hypothetical protein
MPTLPPSLLLGTDPNVQGLNPTRDAAILESHIVSRPDLVQMDQDGKPSEIATLIVGGKVFEDWEGRECRGTAA